MMPVIAIILSVKCVAGAYRLCTNLAVDSTVQPSVIISVSLIIQMHSTVLGVAGRRFFLVSLQCSQQQEELCGSIKGMRCVLAHGAVII